MRELRELFNEVSVVEGERERRSSMSEGCTLDESRKGKEKGKEKEETNEPDEAGITAATTSTTTTTTASGGEAGVPWRWLESFGCNDCDLMSIEEAVVCHTLSFTHVLAHTRSFTSLIRTH